MSAILSLESEYAPGTPATDLILSLARPFLGFSSSWRFRLHGLGEAYLPFLGLSSLDEELRFIVVEPGQFFDDYRFAVPEEDVALLDLEGPKDAQVLVLVSRVPGATPTVNLMGPVVLNRRSGVATQVVLTDGRYRAAMPLGTGRSVSDA